MEFITEFIANFGWKEGLISLAFILIALVFVLWLDHLDRKKMNERYFD